MRMLMSSKLYIFLSFLICGCVISSIRWWPYSFPRLVTSTASNMSRSDIIKQLRRTGLRIKQLLNTTTRICEIKHFGHSKSGETLVWGSHPLCNIPPKKPCLFYSFGIDNDYSFDTNLANTWQCQGLAFDPTVEYKSRLHPNVTFHMIGAKMLSEEDNKQWSLVASVTALENCFKHKINILKMDCEGCEFSLARDVENEMPDFFSTIDQVALEIHVSKFWIKTWSHVVYLTKLFQLLENNNLQLVDAQLVTCNSYHEDFGCPSILLESGYPCARRIMCQNLLFARV
jgi:hypothetical protein